MDSGQIRLRWTSHQGTVLSVFDALLSSESFVDVTLACEGQYIRAHRVILSACSPYFQKLLDLDSSKHPIFFLKDVKYTELKALVEYMYRGEVNIAQDDLQSLLTVAQALKVRGLSEVETTNYSISSDTIIVPEIGSKARQKPPPPPIPQPQPPPPPSSMAIPTITSTPSIVHMQRNFPPTRSFPSSSNASSTGHIPSSSAPPAMKKSKIEPKSSAQTTTHVQKVSPQIADPLLEIQTSPAASSQHFDPLDVGGSSTSAYYHPSATHAHSVFTPEVLVEEPEVYGDSEVKIEATPHVEVDLDDEEENSMSQSSFSERWQKSEDNNSGLFDESDPDPGQGGSRSSDNGVGRLSVPGGGDGEGPRDRGLIFPKVLPRIFNGRYFHMSSDTYLVDKITKVKRRRIEGLCTTCHQTLVGQTTSNFIAHLKRSHPECYEEYRDSQPPPVDFTLRR